MARLWEGINCTLVNNKYKIRLCITLQASINILNKCSCVSEDTKWVPSLLRFVAIWSSYSLKRVFLRKSCDAPMCFPEPRFGFPTLVRTHATTQAQNLLLCYGRNVYDVTSFLFFFIDLFGDRLTTVWIDYKYITTTFVFYRYFQDCHLPKIAWWAFQFVIFKPLSYYFEERIGFDVKASFVSCPSVASNQVI